MEEQINLWILHAFYDLNIELAHFKSKLEALKAVFISDWDQIIKADERVLKI